MCEEKNSPILTQVAIRLGSDQSQSPGCHILGVLEEATLFLEKGCELLHHMLDFQDHVPTSSVC